MTDPHRRCDWRLQMAVHRPADRRCSLASCSPVSSVHAERRWSSCFVLFGRARRCVPVGADLVAVRSDRRLDYADDLRVDWPAVDCSVALS